ncbi:hypothetical protein HNP99_001103 [Flavobacterium sp. 28A]|uniref:hypothetical protein n=1 Tax=Flavobacterium sp. 28A TaxID=2735895 RepID=UPI00156FE31A|nr:hypothetical protein [Flavobacterium sp. 28A]NRT14759.1 hypothetical protein [Flavobacterium sp. 28A]
MEEKELTIHQIQAKLETPIFEIHTDDNKYHTREFMLKKNINQCFISMKENSQARGLDYKLDHWERYVVERNQANLVKYLYKLYYLLNKHSIINYFENRNSDVFHPMMEEDDMIFIVNSYYTTIVYDILWASNIAVSDVINLSQNKVDNNNLIRKFPDMIKYIKTDIIPYLESIPLYKSKAETLKEATEAFAVKLYKATSSLILIELDGLVRLLGGFLIEKQNIDKKLLKPKYHSMDSYLRNVPWLLDYEIETSKLKFLTGDFVFHKDYKIDKIEKISLETRLGFLKRRFKGDRNSILHGDIVFGETWDLYVNFSALFEVYQTIKFYENHYYSQ